MAKAETAGLAAKLVRVMREVRQPRQSARHDYQKFDYSTRDDIFEVVRVALVEAGVAICTSLHLISQSEAGKTSRGIAQTRCVVRLDVQLIDSESGEELPCSWLGEAVTTEDKGIQGAATQAARFWAINQFMLMDGRESELHSQSGPPAAEPARESAKDAAAELVALLESKGLNAAELKLFQAYIADHEKKGSVNQISPQRLGVWVKQLAEVDASAMRQRINKDAA